MIEAEIKVKINDLNEMRKKISNFKGIYKLSLHHEDTYFNMPEGIRNFQETDEALRIRNSTEFNKHNKIDVIETQNYLTYKGRKLDKITKTREEIEIKIDDISKTKNILLRLGFRDILTVVKERELYEFIFEENKINVLLDYLPILNMNFMEVELIVESLEEVEPGRKVLFNFLRLFGINEMDSIRKSYLELIIEHSKLKPS